MLYSDKVVTDWQLFTDSEHDKFFTLLSCSCHYNNVMAKKLTIKEAAELVKKRQLSPRSKVIEVEVELEPETFTPPPSDPVDQVSLFDNVQIDWAECSQLGAKHFSRLDKLADRQASISMMARSTANLPLEIAANDSAIFASVQLIKSLIGLTASRHIQPVPEHNSLTIDWKRPTSSDDD